SQRLSSGRKLGDDWPDKPASGAGDGLNYAVEFDPEIPLSGRVLFPYSPSETNGMEDARFVAFEDGRYLGTYTAYNGRAIRPQLVETRDFRQFRIRPFYGKAAS
ncbi:hypothetical protein RZS08_54510, partial [Arthrospira platensis SPKY1]|nr:hypothetical protein [Arthrospira platensis SPKY1]